MLFIHLLIIAVNIPSSASAAELTVPRSSHPCPGDPSMCHRLLVTAEGSTDGTMQAQNCEQNKADWSLKDLLQKISQSCWTNFPVSSAYWVCFLLSHPCSVQLQEGPRVSGHQAGASRAPGWIMSVFQPGTDGVRKCLGPRRTFCKLMFGL